ncbi:MAG: lysophospholipid acyltransferase family protein [Acidobacteriota bacterium]
MSEPRRGSYLWTALAVVYLIPATLVLASAAILLSWVPPRGNLMCALARVWSRGLLWVAGVRVEAEIPPTVAAGKGFVYLANHQSYFDIPALLSILPGTLRFAAKRSLFLIPVFGWALWAGGFIPVDRRDRSKAREVYRAASQRLHSGASVLFFPEGTRSPDGRVGTFERGGFLVALKAGAAIVPVGVQGTRDVLPRDSWRIQPGTVRLRLGEPIAVADYGLRRKGELVTAVREKVLDLSAEASALEDEPATGS